MTKLCDVILRIHKIEWLHINKTILTDCPFKLNILSPPSIQLYGSTAAMLINNQVINIIKLWLEFCHKMGMNKYGKCMR